MDYFNLLNPVELIKFILNWIGRPKPEIKFEYLLLIGEKENAYCHIRINNSFNNKESWFFRIGIKNNSGKQLIENADVRMEKIERINNGIKTIVFNTPFFLHWANDNTDGSRNIYPGTEEFLDVVFTVKDFNKFFIFYKSKHNISGIINNLPAGKYIFTVKLLGKNINPVEKRILINFNNDWRNLKMSIEK
jgi:hypothetical protein